MQDQNQNIDRGICSYGKRAKLSLTNKWLISAGIVFAIITIPSVINVYLNIAIGIFGLLNTQILFMGFNQFFLNIRKGQDMEFKDICFGFPPIKRGIQSLFLMLLVYAGTLIGLILLIVPGIIFFSGTSQAAFIFIQNPQISCIQAIKRSWKMMKGKKRQFFALYLISVLWLILGFLCLVFGYFFAVSYVMTMFADFYMIQKSQEDELKQIVNNIQPPHPVEIQFQTASGASSSTQ